MKVLIVGLPLFGSRLQKELQAFDPGNKYYFLDTYYSKKDKIKAFFMIPRVDVVYSINGALDKSGVFDYAFRWKKKIMMTWVGTDVTKARKLKEVNKLYKEKAHHYCEVGWIQEELREHLGLEAKILNFFNFSEQKEISICESKTLNVLVYIAKNREAYYGWNEIIEAAVILPEVQFTIVGTEGVGEFPTNVVCKGWVSDMNSLYELNHATIRFVKHDGLSGFVLESLYRGKQVLYSENLIHCIKVDNTAQMVQKLSELSNRLQSGDSLVNVEGSEYVKQNFNRDKILSELIEEIKK